MKTILLKRSVRSFFTTICLLVFSMITIAQNAADSDLSNEADTNKNWSGAGWLIGLAIILVVVVLFTLRGRRRS